MLVQFYQTVRTITIWYHDDAFFIEDVLSRPGNVLRCQTRFGWREIKETDFIRYLDGNVSSPVYKMTIQWWKVNIVQMFQAQNTIFNFQPNSHENVSQHIISGEISEQQIFTWTFPL